LFYFAVTTEGEVGAGDVIEQIARAEETLTVTDVVNLCKRLREPGA
jgi:MOSC domain-containing protein YiiM